MTTNLIVRLETNVLQRLEHYAQEHGSTASEIVEAQIQRLVRSQVPGKEKRTNFKLRGVIKVPKDFDYKKELEDRF